MTPKLIAHFQRWGLEVHVGTGTKGSKSEVLFCAKPPRCYDDPSTYDETDLSDIQMPDGSYMPVVDIFKYLGSYLSRDCKDGRDVDSRIESAGKAFGALRKCLFATASISRDAKRTVYKSVILSILLYGCECWSLSEILYDRLRTFHAQCVRTMSRLTRLDTWKRRIPTAKLCSELGIESIDYYIARRQVSWLGRVSRMSFNRLPRRMLSSWVNHKRPKGAAEMTYGRSVKKALGYFGIKDTWTTLAAPHEWKKALMPAKFQVRDNRKLRHWRKITPTPSDS